MADQTPQQLAEGMIPGAPFMNFLHGIQQQVMPQRQPALDPRVAQAQALQMRRSRVGYGIQQQRAQLGQRPLNDAELNAMIDRQLLPPHLQPGVPATP